MDEQKYNNGQKGRRIGQPFRVQEKKKPNKNYVQQQVERDGPDFAIKKCNQKDWANYFAKDAKRIFNDMRLGFFNPEIDSQYIMYKPFMDALIKIASDKSLYYHTHLIGLDLLKNQMSVYGPIDSNIISIDQYDRVEASAWDILVNGLSLAQCSPYYVQEFTVMINQLRTCRQPGTFK